MRHTPLLLSAAVVFGGAAVVGRAKDSSDPQAAAAGAALFKAHCARCHGDSGRGDGPFADKLEFAPADLTRISQRNRGKFPFDKVVQVVDGRRPLKGHVRTDMPVWGDALLDPREKYDPDKVKAKIRQLVQYVASIQEGSAPRNP